MKRIAYSAPEAEVVGVVQELPVLTLSNPDVEINISRDEEDGYGEECERIDGGGL